VPFSRGFARLFPVSSPEEEVRRVAEALREAIHSRHSSQRKVERALHQGKGYLSQLLKGSVDLKLKHVFAILRTIGVGPDEFFLDLYEESNPVAAVRGLVASARMQSDLEDLRNRIAALEGGAGAATKRSV
jgi:transcriptional regulator with XRE-family HTH domain